MTDRELLSGFFRKAGPDKCIGIAHIGLYAVLVELWARQDFYGPVKLFSYDVRPVAKLFASKTYYKLLRDLHDGGYLRYEPSHYPHQGSTIILKGL